MSTASPHDNDTTTRRPATTDVRRLIDTTLAVPADRPTGARARLAHHWWRPVSPRALAWCRIAMVGYGLVWLLVRFASLDDTARLPAERFDPVSLVALVLDEPLAVGWVQVLWLLTALAGLAALIGWRWSISGPAFALGCWFVLGYRHSWGVVLHTDNLLVLHLSVLAVTNAADDLVPGRRAALAHVRYRWPLILLGAVGAVAYVIAAWAKLRNGGWDWVDGEVLRGHVASDNLRKLLLGDPHSPVGGWLSGHSWPWLPLALTSLVIELGAPLALLGPRWGRVMAVAVWGFHLGVLILMGILFAYPLIGIGLLPWWLAGGSDQHAGPTRPAPAAAELSAR